MRDPVRPRRRARRPFVAGTAAVLAAAALAGCSAEATGPPVLNFYTPADGAEQYAAAAADCTRCG